MRTRRILVATLALVLAAGAAALAFSGFQLDGGTTSSPTAGPTSASTPTPSPGPPLTGEPRVTAEIPIVDDPGSEWLGGLAVGAGSTWVGLQQEDTAWVVRVALDTNEIVARIPVEGAPARKRIAATDNAVWVASSGLLQRIDPEKNSVVAQIDLPGRDVSALASSPEALWAITVPDSFEEAVQVGASLVRVDVSTNHIVAEIPLGPQLTGYEDQVAVGAGAVWVLGVNWTERDNAEHGSDLIRIDPATNEVTDRIPVGGFRMVVTTEEVWVESPADGVFDSPAERWLWTRVSAETSEPSEPFEFDGRGLKSVSPEALWSVGYDERQSVRVTRFDPETLERTASSEPIGSLYHDAVLDPSSGTVWISTHETLVRTDIT